MDLSDIDILKKLDDLDSREFTGSNTSLSRSKIARKDSMASDEDEFDDYDGADDDDLADLLYDDDSPSTKKKSPVKKANHSPEKKAPSNKRINVSKNEEEVEPAAGDINLSSRSPSTYFPSASSRGKELDSSNTSSKRGGKSKIDLFLEEEEKYLEDSGIDHLEDLVPKASISSNKPVLSPQKPKLVSRKSVDIEFNDEVDILSSLEDTKRNSSPVKSKRQSFMDDLFGKDTSKPSVKKISSIFDSKSEKPTKDDDQDDVMVYGGYVPSAATNRRSGGRRQSVTFENGSPGKKNLVKEPKKDGGVTEETLWSSRRVRSGNGKTASIDKVEAEDLFNNVLSSPSRKNHFQDSPKRDIPKSALKKTTERAEESTTATTPRRRGAGADWLAFGSEEADIFKTPARHHRKSDEAEKDTEAIKNTEVTSHSATVYKKSEQPPWLTSTPSPARGRKSVPDSPLKSKPVPTETAEITKQSIDVMTNSASIIQSTVDYSKHIETTAPMQQHIPSGVSPMPVSSVSPTPLSHRETSNTAELQALVSSLQFERDQLLKSVELTSKKKEDDLRSFETTLKSQQKTIEETLERRIKSMQEEHELELRRLKAELNAAEEEKKQLDVICVEKTTKLESNHEKEVKKLKEFHSEAMAMIKRDHEEAVARLKRLRDQEIDAINSTQSQAKSLQSLSDQLESRAAELAALQLKVEERHQSAIKEKEALLVAKERDLKALEGRLRWQMEEGDQERARLQQLVLRLENRLQQQTKDGEEEHWNVQQLTAKLQVQQKFLEEERKMLMESIEREKEKLRLSQNSLLQEQKTIVVQLAQERQQLTSEKLQLELLAKRIREEEARLTARQLKEESSIESQRRLFEDESEKLHLEKELSKQETFQIRAEREALERERRQLATEKQRFNDMKMELKRKSDEVEEMAMKATSEMEESRAARAAARRIEGDHQSRMNQFTHQMQTIMDKEKLLLQEREKISEERSEFQKTKNNTLCVNCKLAIGLPMTALPPVQQPTPVRIGVANVPNLSTVDPNLMVWYLSAQRDHDYLEEQLSFLKDLRDCKKK